MFKVKRDSWHYHWLVWYTALLNVDAWRYDAFASDLTFEKAEECVVYDRSLPTDFCAYWRRVLVWPAIRIGANLFVWATALSIMYAIGLPGLIGASLIVGILAGLAVLFVTLFGLSEGGKLLKARFRKKTAVLRDDELISAAYESYKDKFCTVVDYEEEAK